MHFNYKAKQKKLTDFIWIIILVLILLNIVIPFWNTLQGLIEDLIFIFLLFYLISDKWTIVKYLKIPKRFLEFILIFLSIEMINLIIIYIQYSFNGIDLTIGFKFSWDKNLIYLFILITLVEEIIYRYVLIINLQYYFNNIICVFVISFIFSISHLDNTLEDLHQAHIINQGFVALETIKTLIGTFLPSLIYCYFMIKSKSLILPILAHEIHNFFACSINFTLVQPIVSNYSNKIEYLIVLTQIQILILFYLCLLKKSPDIYSIGIQSQDIIKT
jgi:membrane protease YdiL (CAAX protease family)